MRGITSLAAAALLVTAAISPVAAQIAPNTVITRTDVPGGGESLTAMETDVPATDPQDSPAPPIQFTKSVSQHQVAVGGKVTYLFSATNTGSTTADVVQIIDTDVVAAIVAGYLTFVSQDFVSLPEGYSFAIIETNTGIGGKIESEVDHIPAGTTYSFEVVVQVNGPPGASVTNQATLTVNCPGVVNPAVEDDDTCPEISSDDPDTPAVGDPTVITFIGLVPAPAIGAAAFGMLFATLLVFGSWRVRIKRVIAMRD